jgi:hypothetical protein
VGRHRRRKRAFSNRFIALAGLVMAAGSLLASAGQLAVGIVALPNSGGPVIVTISPSKPPGPSREAGQIPVITAGIFDGSGTNVGGSASNF